MEPGPSRSGVLRWLIQNGGSGFQASPIHFS